MKELIVFIFLFDFFQRIICNCTPYSYDPNTIQGENGTYMCVFNNIIHPCPDDSFCEFSFDKENIACIPKENNHNSFFDSYIDNLFMGRRLEENSTCHDDKDCPFGNGCLGETCTPYFSLFDLSKVPEGGRRFCKSYFEIDGQCQTLTNIYPSTYPKVSDDNSTKCIYRNRYNKIFELQRECGFDGKGYCKEYSGRVADKYITMLKIMFVNNTNCDDKIDERLKLCKKDILEETDNNLKERVRFFNLTEIRYEYEYKMPSLLSDSSNRTANDIISIIFPYYNRNHTDEVKRECPIFKCEEKNVIENKNETKGACLISYTKGINDTNVTLIKDVCSVTEFCSINGSNPLMLMQGKPIEGHCEKITNSVSPKKYPGEICKSNGIDLGYCVNNVSCTSCSKKDKDGNCIEFRCEGKKENETCSSSIECNATLYCNETNFKCMPQVGRNYYCYNTTSCKNKYVCHNHTCIDYFSLNDGDSIINEFDSNKIPLEYFCKYSTVDYETKTCYSLISDSKDENIEFDECIQGDRCVYNTTLNTKVTKICECGFNNLGKAYCPLPHNREKSLWHKYFEAVKSKFNNKCHTLNRFNCNETNAYALKDISFYSHYLEKGHLFYKSVKCAVSVLNDNYIQMKYIILLILLSIIIM